MYCHCTIRSDCYGDFPYFFSCPVRFVVFLYFVKKYFHVDVESFLRWLYRPFVITVIVCAPLLLWRPSQFDEVYYWLAAALISLLFWFYFLFKLENIRKLLGFKSGN